MLMPFKQRFLSGLPETPPELNLQLDEFIVFESESLSGIDASSKRLLLENGLPRCAPPFLAFSSSLCKEIESLRECGAIPEHFFPFGQNAYGDLLGIDTATKEIVYFNHDDQNRRVFINSTLIQFLECLCIYQEYLRSEAARSSLGAIEKIDPAAAKQGTMWHTEALSG